MAALSDSGVSSSAPDSGRSLPRCSPNARCSSATTASASFGRAARIRRGLLSAACFRTLRVLSNQEAILSSSLLADQRRSRLVGLGMTLLSAFLFSLITTFARIAYDAGSNPATQVFLRSLCIVAVLGGLQILAGRSLLLARRTVGVTLGFAVCIFLMSFGYLSSVAYISVSLAVLVLYTYPLMVGVASPLLGRERMTWVKALCLVGAFVGLAVASSEGFGALDWR